MLHQIPPQPQRDLFVFTELVSKSCHLDAVSWIISGLLAQAASFVQTPVYV